MATIRYRTVDAPFLDTGAGEAIVFLHAGASSGRQWQKITDALGPTYRHLAPDLIGFGATAAWPGPGELTHDHQAELVRTLIDTACDGPVHVVGHSYGGSTAVRLAIHAPDRVKSLILIEPNLVPLLQEAGDDAVYDDYCRFAEGFMADADAGREDAAWEAFVDLRNGAGTWQAMPEKARTRLRGLTRQTVDGFKSNLSNPTSLADIRQLDIPTLVVCGGNTTLAERRITEILARTLPDCRYVTIPDAEHMSPVTHPAAVAAVIAEHLAMSDELRRRRAG